MTRAEKLDSAIAYAADVRSRKTFKLSDVTNIRLTFQDAKKRPPYQRVKVTNKS